MPELRKDYVLDRWVIIAAERAKRPEDFSLFAAEKKQTVCPFCPGNEHMTPPETAKEGPAGRWSIRVIPNKFSAVSEGDYWSKKGFLVSEAAVGYHEVIIETPEHNRRLEDNSAKKIKQILGMYKNRYTELMKKRKVGFVLIFRNYGKEGGASLEHPHSQIITTRFVPELIKDEMSGAKKYRKKKKRCVYCDIAKRESRSERLVVKNRSFAVIAPFASRFPFETWILARKHISSLKNMSDTVLNDLALIIKELLLRYRKLFTDMPYNFVLHQSENRQYHFHIELMPVLSIMAGFEKGGNIYINTVSPEQAASQLS